MGGTRRSLDAGRRVRSGVAILLSENSPALKRWAILRRREHAARLHHHFALLGLCVELLPIRRRLTLEESPSFAPRSEPLLSRFVQHRRFPVFVCVDS